MRHWTSQEIVYLQTHYLAQPTNITAQFLGRTKHSVKQKANRIGLFQRLEDCNRQRAEDKPKRKCLKCQNEFPFTSTYFYWKGNGRPRDQLEELCRTCYSKQVKEQRKELAKLKEGKRLSSKENKKINFTFWRETPSGKLSKVRRSAQTRGLEFALTIDDINRLWQQPCLFCGSPIPTVGIDRLDNSRGYVPDNIVSCCRKCNIIKLDHNLSDLYIHLQKMVFCIKDLLKT